MTQEELRILWKILDARDMSIQKMTVALLEKERVICEQNQRLQDNEIQKKQKIIEQQRQTIRAYRAAYGPSPLIVIRPIGRAIRRATEIIRPRLGNLNQYAPRKLSLSCPAQAVSSCNLPLKISIVTPSFQQGGYIEHTLKSVLEQGYPNLEYFVQDACSSDQTVVILKRYEQALSGWSSEADSGQSHAINKGFARTTGEIMAWLNSDDLLLPGALACVAEYFERHSEVDVVYGNRLMINEDGMEIGRWILPGHDGDLLSWADYVPQETLFWRRSLWEKVGGQIDESFKFAMDWDLLVRFREVGAKFSHIPQFLGAFRIHHCQKTSATINEVGYQEMDRIRERLLGKVPSRNEIRKAVFPFMLRHVIIDIFYRIKKRLGGKQ